MTRSDGAGAVIWNDLKQTRFGRLTKEATDARCGGLVIDYREIFNSSSASTILDKEDKDNNFAGYDNFF